MLLILLVFYAVSGRRTSGSSLSLQSTLESPHRLLRARRVRLLSREIGGAPDQDDSPHEDRLQRLLKHHWQPQEHHTSELTQWLVHVKAPITCASRRRLEKHITPYKLGQYLPDNTFVVVAKADFQRRLESAPTVLWAREHVHADKVARSLSNLLMARNRRWLQEETDRNKASTQGSQQEAREGHGTGELSRSFELIVRLNPAFFRAATADNDLQHGSRTRGGGTDPDRGEEWTQTEQLTQRWRLLLADRGLGTTTSQPGAASRDGDGFVRLKVADPCRMLLVTTPHSLLEPVVAFLLQRREVEWIEPRPIFKVQNKHAKFVLQTDSNRTTLWEHGLLGQGQVVSVGDTGMDWDSCFFSDPDQAVPMDTVSLDHRKIVRYVSLGDKQDDVAGHGSHVAGSIAGEAHHSNDTVLATLTPYNGMAPKAKLAFYDLKKTNDDDLLVPPAIYNDMWKDGYDKVGACIASNSWGSPDGDYGSYSRETDRFSHDYPDFLAVFAAGNYGDKGFFSISSPGVAKNVLTVGSTKSNSESFFELGEEAGIEVILPHSIAGSYAAFPADFGPSFHDMKLPRRLGVVVADPLDACAPLRNADQCKGKAVLVPRGTCFFTDKAKRVQEAGALLLIVVQNEIGPAIVMGTKPSDDFGYTMPSVMVEKHIGELMIEKVDALKINAPIDFEIAEMNEGVVPSFSSRGPTYDSRLKPDVLTPGMFIVSVKSDGDIKSNVCTKEESLVSMQGTSMSTPIAAGGVALVRQYFMEGFYPSGTRIPEDSFVPSGSLLKALMVASAVPVAGHVMTNEDDSSKDTTFEQVAESPSVMQGYGRVQLDSVLFFNASSKFDLWIQERQKITSLELKSWCFLVQPPIASGVTSYSSRNQHTTDSPTRDPTPLSPPPSASPDSSNSSNSSSNFTRSTAEDETRSDAPFLSHESHAAVPHALRATLVWADPPAAAGATVLLVNDLDLFVVDVGTEQVYLGNSHHFDDADGSHDTWDVLNNVEQVDLGPDAVVPSGSIMSVHVRGTHVPKGPQAFALVVTGAVTPLPLQSCAGAVICPKGCSGHGSCSDLGMCVCDKHFMGADCSSESAEMIFNPHTGDFTHNVSVAVGGWEYMHFLASEGHKVDGFSILMERVIPRGDPDMYVEFDSTPSLRNHAYAATGCDPCGDESHVTVQAAEVQSGLYRIGVFGYCCDSAAVNIRVTGRVDEPTLAVKSPRSIFIAISIVLVALVVVVGACLMRWRCRRRGSRCCCRKGFERLATSDAEADTTVARKSGARTAPSAEHEMHRLSGDVDADAHTLRSPVSRQSTATGAHTHAHSSLDGHQALDDDRSRQVDGGLVDTSESVVEQSFSPAADSRLLQADTASSEVER